MSKSPTPLTCKARYQLKISNGGRCFHCFKKWQYTQLNEWIDSEMTATCPHCFTDSVIPFNALPEIEDDCIDMLEDFADYVEKHDTDVNDMNDASEYESDASDNVTDTINVFRNNTTQPTPKKTGRNEQCPCGSGKKFKKCCG